MEKRPKFKPRRQDFTLELLCGNNLFDNIIIESGAVLKEVESVIPKQLVPEYRELKNFELNLAWNRERRHKQMKIRRQIGMVPDQVNGVRMRKGF